MRIVLLCEGKTEKAITGALKEFMDNHCNESGAQRVGLDIMPFGGRAVDCEEVTDRLNMHGKRDEVIGVIALTDVYPEFQDAKTAKKRLKECVKDSPFEHKFHAHAAQFELEAWLLPFWDDICRKLKLKGKAKPPGENPEQVNSQKPPSKHLKELYRRAKPRREYDKVLHAPKILKDGRIAVAAEKCHELGKLLKTLENLCEKGRS